jgi:hypothetical protein
VKRTFQNEVRIILACVAAGLFLTALSAWTSLSHPNDVWLWLAQGSSVTATFLFGVLARRYVSARRGETPLGLVSSLSALLRGVIGEIGWEALETLHEQKQMTLVSAAAADVSRVKGWYVLVTAYTVVSGIGDRMKTLVFPSTKLD